MSKSKALVWGGAVIVSTAGVGVWVGVLVNLLRKDSYLRHVIRTILLDLLSDPDDIESADNNNDDVSDQEKLTLKQQPQRINEDVDDDNGQHNTNNHHERQRHRRNLSSRVGSFFTRRLMQNRMSYFYDDRDETEPDKTAAFPSSIPLSSAPTSAVSQQRTSHAKSRPIRQTFQHYLSYPNNIDEDNKPNNSNAELEEGSYSPRNTNWAHFDLTEHLCSAEPNNNEKNPSRSIRSTQCQTSASQPPSPQRDCEDADPFNHNHLCHSRTSSSSVEFVWTDSEVINRIRRKSVIPEIGPYVKQTDTTTTTSVLHPNLVGVVLAPRHESNIPSPPNLACTINALPKTAEPNNLPASLDRCDKSSTIESRSSSLTSTNFPSLNHLRSNPSIPDSLDDSLHPTQESNIKPSSIPNDDINNNNNNDFAVHDQGRKKFSRTSSNARIMPHSVILIRHGQSMGNADGKLYSQVPDNAMPITKLGWEEARAAGRHLKTLLGDRSPHFIVSPYTRTVETFHGLASAWCDPSEFAHISERDERLACWYSRLLELGLTWNEDPRIREQDFGNYQNVSEIAKAKEDRHRFGVFYYRFPYGESASDVFDRISIFLDSLWRSFYFNKERIYIVVTHGIAMRGILARYFQYTVFQFSMLANPTNCEMVVLQSDNKDRLQLCGRYALKLQKDEDSEDGDTHVVGIEFHKRLRVLPDKYIRKVPIRISYDDDLQVQGTTISD